MAQLFSFGVKAKTYNDDYPTCAYTHAWLRIMHADLKPDEITKQLRIAPTQTQMRGDSRILPKSGKRTPPLKFSGWFVSSRDRVSSYDARRHIDWVLRKFRGKSAVLRKFRRKGYLVDMCCRWDSRSGHGGPTLSPRQIKQLAELEMEFWFDIYFLSDGERRRRIKRSSQRRAASAGRRGSP